jgi:hypothetical protein
MGMFVTIGYGDRAGYDHTAPDVLEAGSLDEAAEIASRAPCAVAQGVVEVWPLEQAPVSLVDGREA